VVRASIRGMVLGRTMQRRRAPPVDRCARLSATALLVVGGLLGFAEPAASAADFTWSGLTPNGATSANWSNGTNWVGDSAPGGSVGTLNFPALTSSACTASPPTDTCYTGANDLSGVSANSLTIDDGQNYTITGNPIALGSGGITAGPSANDTLASSGPFVDLPINLSGNQTWSVTGGSNGQQLTIGGAVTGSASSVNISLGAAASLSFYADAEVGPVSVTSTDSLSTINVGNPGNPGSLNGTDGDTVSFSGGAGLLADPGTVGPLTMAGGEITIGDTAFNGSMQLSIDGAASLDSSSSLQLFITNAGTTAGTDFSQLSASGTVDLGGASLLLSGSLAGCPTLHAGDVDTLLTTSGTLTGTFAGIADGATVSLNCQGGTAPTVRINYTHSTVTATVLTAGGGGSVPVDQTPPTISGTADEGQTLIESNGTWTNNPTSFSYQWEDCDNSGNNCTAISGAIAQTYDLTSSDVGHTIEVQEVASNSNGAGTPATSAPTATVVVPPAPSNTDPPTIAGTATQGQRLTESHGIWSNNPTSFSYQWQDCDSSGASCAAIAGATSQTYTLTAGDVCHTIRVEETASNSGGPSSPASSAHTSVAQASGNSYSWMGLSPFGDGWSVESNWAGCRPAPSGTVGTLTFPAAACLPGCADSTDDVPGLVASNLDVGSINLGGGVAGYSLGSTGGTGLTLTSGLVTSGPGGTSIGLPITLGGPNTWTIGGGVEIYGNLSGSPQPLAMSISGGLNIDGASNEVGDVTIAGPGGVQLGNGPVNARPTSDLNGADGHTVTVDNATLAGAGTVGPLSINGGTLIPGFDPSCPSDSPCNPGALRVDGSMALASASVVFSDLTPGTGSPTPGQDYPQVATTGTASLGGASLSLSADCNQTPGTTYTLVSANDGVSGTFSLADGTIIQATEAGDASCAAPGAAAPAFRVVYAANTVTATVVAAPVVQTNAASAVQQATTANGSVNPDGFVATLNGSVNPNGLALSDCHFEYGTSTAYGSTVPCAQSVGPGFSSVPVSADLSLLGQDITYHFRLVATNVAGTAIGQDATLTPVCPSGPNGGPNICSVVDDNGPVLGGTQIFIQGSGFQPGDRLCFYVAPYITGPAACAFQVQVYSSGALLAVTPSLKNSAAVGYYYLGIERCCSYNPGTNSNTTSDYVSTTRYLYFPPPPVGEPSDCQIFSLGSDACWRVGLGVVLSGLFDPGRPPDYVLVSLGAGSAVVSGAVEAAVTCSGDLWIGGSYSVGSVSILTLLDSPLTAMIAQGYVGLPTDGPLLRTYADVDGFISGFTGNISAGIIAGFNVVLTAQAPGPDWAVEYWAGTNVGGAFGGSLSEYVLGPDPYSRGIFPTALSNAGGTTCGDVYTTPTFQALLQASVGAVGVLAGGAKVAVLCPSAGGCSGSASLTGALGGPTADEARMRRRDTTSNVLGTARFTIPAQTAGRVLVRLDSTTSRLLFARGGRVKARLTLSEMIGGRPYHEIRIIMLELAPRVTDVAQSAAKWREASPGRSGKRVGTAFRFTANEACEVGLTFTQRRSGRTVTVAQVVVEAHQGKNVIRFRGVISSKNHLAPGRYTAYVIAANTAGQRSIPHRLTFTILP
jgi:hypothetical protein